MSSNATNLGQISTSSTTTQPPRLRPRQRGHKREGPPQLQFLVATDLSQFKNESAKRSVRSQAMIQYRYNTSEEKKKKKKKKNDVQQSPPLNSQLPSKAKLVRPVVRSCDNEVSHRHSRPPMQPCQQTEHIYRTTSEAWHRANAHSVASYQSQSPHTTLIMPLRPSRYCRALATMSMNAHDELVLNYEDTDEHENRFYCQMSAIFGNIAPLRAYGDGIDPFQVMPKFASQELDSFKLVRICNRTFSSASTLAKWLPAMLSHPHVLLSSTVVASTWMDMHAGVSGESMRTVVVKGEIISWIKERLADAALQNDDTTLIVIVHMLAGEMWSCNEQTLRIHERAVARLVKQRGGMDCIGSCGGTIPQTLACVCYHSNIICEVDPLPMFAQWFPPPLALDDSTPLPESPLFCKTEELLHVASDPACKEYTYDLLCDMRELTNLFISRYDTIQHVEVDGKVTQHNPTLSLDYDAKIATIRTKLALLPSAHAQGLPTSNDWVYESCRIAAIIYTSSIIMQMPLSVCADPLRNAVLLDAAPADHAVDFARRLTEQLYEVIELTNIGDIWRNMSGVFYWVTAVGAAAARTPVTTNTYQNPGTHGGAYTTWIRRCLMMFATRAMIILMFQHPIPISLAQRKLLRVQKLIGRGVLDTETSVPCLRFPATDKSYRSSVSDD